MSAQGAVALVSGAARGIGAAIARRLSDDGMAVAVVDVDDDEAARIAESIASSGGRAAAFRADVADSESVTEAVHRIVDTLGPPTVLVNNAGITRDNLLFRMQEADWDAVMNIHLRGAFLLSRAVHGIMRDRGWGRIVNLSSTSALGNRGQANYSAAKAGMQGFTRTLAIELGRFGITVNAIAPGFIETDMTAATAERVGVPFEEYKERAAAAIPVGRVGAPSDVAAAVSFFVSDDASFVSGQVLYVAGGPRG